MITKTLFIALFMISAPAFADTLGVGAVYFDSEQTLNEVVKLSLQHDNEGIAKLIENGHVSSRTGTEMDIVVLITGSTPESPAEFRFLNGPTTYWTMTKNVANFVKPIANSTPVAPPGPEVTPVPEVTPGPAESPPPPTKHHRKSQSHAPSVDDGGQRVWHQVDGKWKWYPASKHHVPVKKALPPDEAPVVKP